MNAQTFQQVVVEFDESIQEFIAYIPGDELHTGYGATVQDAKDSLAWCLKYE